MHEAFLQEGLENKLNHFIEECGEAVAIAGKTLRWGLESTNPLLPIEQQETNKTRLEEEVGDVIFTAKRLLEELRKL